MNWARQGVALAASPARLTWAGRAKGGRHAARLALSWLTDGSQINAQDAAHKWQSICRGPARARGAASQTAGWQNVFLGHASRAREEVLGFGLGASINESCCRQRARTSLGAI